MKTPVVARSRQAITRSLRLLVCAILVALVAVGCHAPLMQVRMPAAGSSQAGASNVDSGVKLSVGSPSDLPSRIASSAGQPTVPSSLFGQPYGAVSISLTWPAVPKYQTQAIPAGANSLRFRIIGDDGKDRLAVWFFRPQNGQLAVQNQVFFLPVETGMFVEARAYAQTQAQLGVPLATPSYNPMGMPDYAAYDASGNNFRVLAEGLQFNFSVTVLKQTPVQVTLDTTQLVAGIGGSGGFNFGGNPYYSNFLQDARFAEMTYPGALFHDHYGPNDAANLAAGQRDRLLFLDYPVFNNVPAPTERDMVELLTTDALEGNADNPSSVPFPEPVKLQMGGGSAPVTNANGDGNTPAFAVLSNPTKLTYLPGSPDTLFILQASTSTALNSVRYLQPVSASAIVNSLAAYNGDTSHSNPQGLVSISAVPGSDQLLAADVATHKIVIADASSSVAELLAGGGAATPSTTATPSLDVGFSDNLKCVASAGGSSFLVLDGSTVLRNVGGQIRIVAGQGGQSPSADPSDADANNLAFGSTRDMVFDSLQQYAYVADDIDQEIYRLGPMPGAIGSPVPFKNIGLSFEPIALATSPTNQHMLYALSSAGQVYAIDNPDSALPGAPTLVLDLSGQSFSVNGLTCGTDASGNDVLYVTTSENGGNVRWASPTNPPLANIQRMFAGGTFGGMTPLSFASADLYVGDGADLQAQIGDHLGGLQLNGTGYLNGPSYLSADSTGDIYIADTRNDRIREIQVSPDNPDDPIDILSLYRADLSLTPQQIAVNEPQGIDVDEYGDVFVSNTGNNVIDVWRPHCDSYESTTAWPIAGTSTGGYDDDNVNALLVQLKAPTAIRVERHANPTDGTPSRRRVFFIDSGNKRVRMLSPVQPNLTAPGACGDDPYFHYIISTVVGGGSGGDGTNAAQAALTAPEDLALDSRGYLYIADGPNIRRVDPVTGSISTIYTASSNLGSITVDDVHGDLYFTLAGQMTIRKILLPQ